jgi:hypothetical protein
MRFRPYIARPIRFLGIAEPQGYRIKQYAIQYGGGPFRDAEFQKGLQMVFDSLPRPAIAPSRPGVGFAIAHQGFGADYAVLAWWDNENELPLRIAVHPQTNDGSWRLARDSESVCVWDLEVMWFERQSYVQTVLGGGSVEDYLQQRIG